MFGSGHKRYLPTLSLCHCVTVTLSLCYFVTVALCHCLWLTVCGSLFVAHSFCGSLFLCSLFVAQADRQVPWMNSRLGWEYMSGSWLGQLILPERKRLNSRWVAFTDFALNNVCPRFFRKCWPALCIAEPYIPKGLMDTQLWMFIVTGCVCLSIVISGVIILFGVVKLRS